MDVDAASTSSAIAAIKARLPAASSLQPQLDALRDTADRKLWHQLTNQLQALLASPESQPIQIELYDSFVKGLSKKLDQRRLVEIATAVAGQYEGECEARQTPAISTSSGVPRGALLCGHALLFLGRLLSGAA